MAEAIRLPLAKHLQASSYNPNIMRWNFRKFPYWGKDFDEILIRPHGLKLSIVLPCIFLLSSGLSWEPGSVYFMWDVENISSNMKYFKEFSSDRSSSLWSTSTAGRNIALLSRLNSGEVDSSNRSYCLFRRSVRVLICTTHRRHPAYCFFRKGSD